jgi:hypothetical protein
MEEIPCPDEEIYFFILRANYEAKKKERCYYTTHERTASVALSASLGHRAFIAAETPPGPKCTSQAQHYL